MYSEKVKKYFENPINMGIIENADSIGIIENEVCSDIIKIYLKIVNDIIVDAKFEAKGCPPVIASCCVITNMIRNINIENAKNITANEIIECLDRLPNEKIHCAEIVIRTLKQAISKYINKRNS